MGYRELRSTTHLLVVVVSCVAVAACGPVGGDSEIGPVEEGADALEAEDERAADDGATDDGAADDGATDDGTADDDDAGEGQLVLGAPFRVPSPSEFSLDGDELTRRIVEACEAAQPSPPPPGPCVEVVIVPRPDPEREPGWWIGTDPAGDQEVAHGSTVTVFVADETSPSGGSGTDGISPSGGSATDGTSTPEELETDGSGSDGSSPEELPADVEPGEQGDVDGGA